MKVSKPSPPSTTRVRCGVTCSVRTTSNVCTGRPATFPPVGHPPRRGYERSHSAGRLPHWLRTSFHLPPGAPPARSVRGPPADPTPASLACPRRPRSRRRCGHPGRKRVVDLFLGVGQLVKRRYRAFILGSEFACPADKFNDVLGAGDHVRAGPQQGMASDRHRRRHRTGHRTHHAAQCTRPGRGVGRTAARTRLDDHRGPGEAGDQPVAGQKSVPRGPHSGRILTDHEAVVADSIATSRRARPDRARRCRLPVPRPSIRRPPARRGGRRRRCRTRRRTPPQHPARPDRQRDRPQHAHRMPSRPACRQSRPRARQPRRGAPARRPQDHWFVRLWPQPVGHAVERVERVERQQRPFGVISSDQPSTHAVQHI